MSEMEHMREVEAENRKLTEEVEFLRFALRNALDLTEGYAMAWRIKAEEWEAKYNEATGKRHE